MFWLEHDSHVSMVCIAAVTFDARSNRGRGATPEDGVAMQMQGDHAVCP